MIKLFNKDFEDKKFNSKFIFSKYYLLIRYLLSIFFFEQINEILSIISAKDMIVKK
jgi:hypothetical protein